MDRLDCLHSFVGTFVCNCTDQEDYLSQPQTLVWAGGVSGCPHSFAPRLITPTEKGIDVGKIQGISFKNDNQAANAYGM